MKTLNTIQVTSNQFAQFVWRQLPGTTVSKKPYNWKKFVRCGFEFTASLKEGKDVTNKGLECMYTSWFSGIIAQYGLRRTYKSKISSKDWIDKRFEDDGGGCEVSTPIVQSKQEITKYYKEFMDFVKSSNLTVNLDEAFDALGGCHIHMDVSFLSKPIKTRFLKNLAIFFTNNPELNWGFNEIEDNWNANSLLTQKFKHSECPCLLPTFLKNPLTYSISKEYVFRYNRTYDSVEFRIFDMPLDLKQHLLHYDVAKAIYDICLKMAFAKKQFKIKYNKYQDYKLDLNVSLSNFKATMKILNIDIKRTKKMLENIKKRYEITTKEDNYLL